MDPLLSAGIVAVIALVIFMVIAWRMMKLHYELSDAYSVISKMLKANSRGDSAEVERIAEAHADQYGFGTGRVKMPDDTGKPQS